MRPYGGWGVWGGGSARPWVLHCASVAPDGLRYGGALRTVVWWHLVAFGVWWGMESHGMVAPGGTWSMVPSPRSHCPDPIPQIPSPGSHPNIPSPLSHLHDPIPTIPPP